MPRDSDVTEIPCLMVGSKGVGKTALLIHLTSNMYGDCAEYEPCAETWLEQVTVDNREYLLNIIHIPRHFFDDDLYPHSLKGVCSAARGFYLVYSVADRRSFDELAWLREQLLHVRGEAARFPMVLIGNKSDLEAERCVSEEEGRRLGAEFGCPWFEISAKAEFVPSPLGPTYAMESTGRVKDLFCELVRVCPPQERGSRTVGHHGTPQRVGDASEGLGKKRCEIM